MLEKNNEGLFYLLLVPTYLNVLIMIVSLSFGFTVIWFNMIIYSLLNLSGAWLLSYHRNYVFNLLGFSFFLAHGWPLFFTLFSPENASTWQISGYSGILILTLGIYGLFYSVVKRILHK